MLTIVEKVIFLQDVEEFEYATTEDLAHIATITDEVTFKPAAIIYREGEVSDSMYMVIEGSVRLDRSGEEVLTAKHKDVFGTWALFDDAPRMLTATALEETRLLRIEREDFYDILADHMKITEGILKSITKRWRALAGRVGSDPADGTP